MQQMSGESAREKRQVQEGWYDPDRLKNGRRGAIRQAICSGRHPAQRVRRREYSMVVIAGGEENVRRAGNQRGGRLGSAARVYSQQRTYARLRTPQAGTRADEHNPQRAVPCHSTKHNGTRHPGVAATKVLQVLGSSSIDSNLNQQASRNTQKVE